MTTEELIEFHGGEKSRVSNGKEGDRELTYIECSDGFRLIETNGDPTTEFSADWGEVMRAEFPQLA